MFIRFINGEVELFDLLLKFLDEGCLVARDSGTERPGLDLIYISCGTWTKLFFRTLQLLQVNRKSDLNWSDSDAVRQRQVSPRKEFDRR